jgi:hypothetical protein
MPWGLFVAHNTFSYFSTMACQDCMSGKTFCTSFCTSFGCPQNPWLHEGSIYAPIVWTPTTWVFWLGWCKAECLGARIWHGMFTLLLCVVSIPSSSSGFRVLHDHTCLGQQHLHNPHHQDHHDEVFDPTTAILSWELQLSILCLITSLVPFIEVVLVTHLLFLAFLLWLIDSWNLLVEIHIPPVFLPLAKIWEIMSTSRQIKF